MTQIEESKTCKTWWARRIDVRELRALAQSWQEYGNEDGAKLLEILRGKRGKLNYVEAGGWCGPNENQQILSQAGHIILNK
jgi:hypothetical protein